MGASAAFLSRQFEGNPLEDFIRLGQEYVDLWQKCGVPVLLTRSDNFEIFQAASQKVQHATLCYLDMNVSVMQEVIRSGESLRNNKVLVWKTLQKLQMVPTASDFLSYVDDSDIIEIYFLDDIQAFRNARFFEICTFTVEEILCRPWYELVGRGWKPLLAMFRMTLKVKLGMVRSMTAWNIPEHVVYEKCTPERVHFSMLLKYFVPLVIQNRVRGILTFNNSVVLPR